MWMLVDVTVLLFVHTSGCECQRADAAVGVGTTADNIVVDVEPGKLM